MATHTAHPSVAPVPYGLAAERLPADQRVAFEHRTRERLDEVPLTWWFAINYYVARRAG